MKIVNKVKKSVVSAKKSYKDAYNVWTSDMKDKVVHFIIDSGKDGDAEDTK